MRTDKQIIEKPDEVKEYTFRDKELLFLLKEHNKKMIQIGQEPIQNSVSNQEQELFYTVRLYNEINELFEKTKHLYDDKKS